VTFQPFSLASAAMAAMAVPQMPRICRCLVCMFDGVFACMFTGIGGY